MFRKIVIATDFSDASRRALEVAVDLAQRYDAELTVVHVSEHMPATEMEGYATWETGRNEALREALTNELRHAQRVRPTARAELLSGAAAEATTQFANENGVDLVVLGTSGRTGAARWILGSVAAKVVRICERAAVLTVHAPQQG